MRIAIDARPAVFPQKTGVGYYTWQLLRHLPRVDPDDTFVAWYLNARAISGGRGKLLGELAAPNLRERGTRLPATWFERLSDRFDAPRLEWLVGFDVLLAPNFVPPPTRTRSLVVTVHDLAFRRFPQTAPQSTRWWLARIDRTLARAARVIAVSQWTKQDLCELYALPPDRVTVIPLGVDRQVFTAATTEEVGRVTSRFGVEGPYVLFLGGIEPRKNLAALVRAFARLPSDLGVQLVVAGAGVAWNPEGRQELEGALGGLDPATRARVRLTGYVSESDKVALLTGARALVYPSLYEGFGLPVLEAMACGTPVLSSNVSAIPEVAGGAALLVDPLDVDAIAAGMERLLRDDALTEELRRAGRERAGGFDWERTARGTAEILREVGESRGEGRAG